MPAINKLPKAANVYCRYKAAPIIKGEAGFEPVEVGRREDVDPAGSLMSANCASVRIAAENFAGLRRGGDTGDPSTLIASCQLVLDQPPIVTGNKCCTPAGGKF